MLVRLEEIIKKNAQEILEKLDARELGFLSEEDRKKVLALAVNELRRQPHKARCPKCNYQLRLVDLIEAILYK